MDELTVDSDKDGDKKVDDSGTQPSLKTVDLKNQEVKRDDGNGDMEGDRLGVKTDTLVEEIDKNYVPLATASAGTKTTTVTSQEEEDCIIFHCVSYLGAAKIHEAKNEEEIQKIMSFLYEQSSETVIQVSVSVPFHSDGFVIVYEEDNQLEISRFKVNQIIFFARGTAGGNDEACFAFTCSHGDQLEQAIFQCHAFRCDVPEAVGRVFQSFARAFEALPKNIEIQSESEPVVYQSSNMMESLSQESSVFEVTLEFKEDDGKGNYSAVPRDKGYFKLKSFIPKQIVLTVQQMPDQCKELIVERCFGLLLSPGRHVRHSDMQLVEMLSWSIGSSNGPAQDRKSYVISGQWDINDPAFEPLNQETSKESCVFLTVAVDLVIKGIQEPIRFVIETMAKVYPASERFWMLGRKHHVTQQFELTLAQIDGCTKGSQTYTVLGSKVLGEVDKSKLNFNLNFTSFIRSSSIELETPTKDDEDSDDDEPLQSGVGEISKYCSDEKLAAWSDILLIWQVDSERPKQLASLVKAGIPDTIRGEVWARLANCQNDKEILEAYKTLYTKECSSEDVILRDITRTFPANDNFKESGGEGQDWLFKISRGYAVYDSEVGYCQGISFIGAALLLQMPEEQAFRLLVKIMYDYGFRDLYRDGFDNLHLTLYQLDKLMEDRVPELWVHFQELGIESHMYASQWFLTCFCGKFPLIFVFRVIDLFLLDGFKTLFQVAIALLSAARKDLVVLDFEGVLKYFRVSLPKKYRTVEASNILIRSSLQMKVKKLKKYQRDYNAIKEQERNYVDPVTRLTLENKKLMEDIMRYEYTVTNLVLTKTTAEETNLQLEEELGRTRMALKEMEDFNARLKEETNSVKELFQKEMKQYDTEGEKKSNIITEYKQICTKLSSQLEVEQKLSRERMNFFQSNLCPTCSNFVSTAINIASSGKTNGEAFRDRFLSPQGDSAIGERSLEEIVRPLENELAKTKIALAEAECRNDDVNHRLSVALSELEAYRTNSSGPAWLWKNLSFNKDNKKMEKSHSLSGEESLTHCGDPVITINPGRSKK